MTFNKCVARKVSAGKIQTQRAQQLLAQYSGIFQAHQQSMGITQAQILAAQQVVAAAKRAAFQKRRTAQLQAAATQTQIQRMLAHRNIKGELSPGDYLQDMISNKRGAGGSTLSGRYEAIRRGFRAELTEAIRAFRANLVGSRRNKDLLENVVRERFGQDTGDALARRISDAFGGVAEKARTRFNAAGGDIGKLDRWGLPQMHDAAKVRKAGFQEWRDTILPYLDLNEMGMRFNNGMPFTAASLEPFLKDTFEAIRTDGYSRRGPMANAGRGAVANQRNDPRFLLFKDAESWMDYSERFGSGRDAFRVMLGHLDGMAQDIAMMEELGPNPMHGYRYLVDAAKMTAARSADPRALERVQSQAKVAEDMFDLFTGRTNIPDRPRIARGAAALRNYLTSAHLGSAILSSVTDFNTQRIAAGFVGLPKLGFMKQLFRLASSREIRNAANDAGLIFENAVDIGNAVARYELEDLHVEAAARMADFTIRASGLGYLTEIQRQAFGLEFMNQAAKSWHGKAFADLDPKTQRMFRSYGISEVDWSLIRQARIHTTQKGLQLLRAQEIEEVAGAAIADRYMEAITSLTDFAIPSTDLYGRAAILGKSKPGSISGEFVRFGLQFKSFPITILVTQFSRIMAEVYQGRRGSAMGYAAGLLIGNTILGALAIQLKEASKGRDPRDATTKEFWAAALLQGGGLGIFGDFFFSDVNRFGSSFAETLAGPGIGFVDDMLRFTVGNARELALGEETKIGREFTNLLRSYTPGGSLWYLRAAYEREVLDRLQRLVDPDAEAAFRRKIKSARDMDTRYFYGPGQSAIVGRNGIRAPDLGNAFGG